MVALELVNRHNKNISTDFSHFIYRLHKRGGSLFNCMCIHKTFFLMFVNSTMAPLARLTDKLVKRLRFKKKALVMYPPTYLFIGKLTVAV